MEAGIKGQAEMIVGEQDTARSHGSGTLDVLATPALIALMERTAWQSIADHLEAGATTVGTAMDMSHTAPTPVGMKVCCESTLIAVDRRALTFQIEARDDRGPIATAKHSRFIVESDTFQKKADAKRCS